MGYRCFASRAFGAWGSIWGKHLAQGFNLGAQEIQLQAWGATAGKLYSTALDLAAIDPRVVVKVPITQEGIEAANLLKANNVRVTMTGKFIAVPQSVSGVRNLLSSTWHGQ
jgi:hypothetical protein